MLGSHPQAVLLHHLQCAKSTQPSCNGFGSGAQDGKEGGCSNVSRLWLAELVWICCRWQSDFGSVSTNKGVN